MAILDSQSLDSLSPVRPWRDGVANYRGEPVGRRIHVTGNSCSGKSTLAKQLAAALGIPRVELDALNWQHGWVSLADTKKIR